MEHTPAAPVAGADSRLTKALCVSMLLLMAAAAGYGGFMALQYFPRIGV
ncbi:MAG: hypothetical protein R2910_00155 [Gemmatimonadales bacterium]